MNQIKQALIKQQLKQAPKITDANRIIPGETFEAYIKRMAAARKAGG